MSSKGTRKTAVASKPNVIVTRRKAAKLRAKNKEAKETEKPVITKPVTNPEKSPKVTKNENCCRDTPLRAKVRQFVELVEQAEYYPDKLKRNAPIKKVLLKPKHNFKVIATANKRKLCVPQKGGVKSPVPKKRRGSSTTSSNQGGHCEMSMTDIVRLMEDTHSLSDEDFMEILTCPSPVWWEDPPDERYIEDAICKRVPSQSSLISISTDDSKAEEQDDKRTSTPTKTNTQLKTNTQTNNSDALVDFENEIQEFKISPTKETNDKFKCKKQKLENVLGNIKNVKIKNKDTIKDEIKNNEIKKNDDNVSKPRRNSTSTDGEDFSDLSFNEEEVLKNLENIQIPIEQSEEHNKNIKTESSNKIEIDIIGTETKKIPIKKTVIPIPIKTESAMPNITVKKFARKSIDSELIVPDKMPPLTRKPDIPIEKSENSDSNTDYLDNVSHSSFRFISDDDISLMEEKICEKRNARRKNSLGESSSLLDTTDKIKEYEIKKERIDTANTTGTNNKNIFFRKKVVSDLSEYITVYKIMSQENEKNDIDSEKLIKNADNTNNNASGKLNNFFKKRKSTKRVKKSDSSVPANILTDVKVLPIDSVNSDDKNSVVNNENRLNPCDYCVLKRVERVKYACSSCNFHADNREIYNNHITSCKDIARLPWNHSFITNQT